jgi:hypothetical protein
MGKKKSTLPIPDKDHPHWTFYVKLHEVGECTRWGGADYCDGIGHWAEDPYAAELRGDHNKVWLCTGERDGRAADI